MYSLIPKRRATRRPLSSGDAIKWHKALYSLLNYNCKRREMRSKSYPFIRSPIIVFLNVQFGSFHRRESLGHAKTDSWNNCFFKKKYLTVFYVHKVGGDNSKDVYYFANTAAAIAVLVVIVLVALVVDKVVCSH